MAAPSFVWHLEAMKPTTISLAYLTLYLFLHWVGEGGSPGTLTEFCSECSPILAHLWLPAQLNFAFDIKLVAKVPRDSTARLTVSLEQKHPIAMCKTLFHHTACKVLVNDTMCLWHPDIVSELLLIEALRCLNYLRNLEWYSVVLVKGSSAEMKVSFFLLYCLNPMTIHSSKKLK